jgi:diguanylate cyclase (GGDEF)-like protein
MFLPSLLAVVLIAATGLIIAYMLKLGRNNRLRGRQAILETYQMRSAITASQKTNELSRRFFRSLGGYSRKNLLLEIAEDFKNGFGLGRFAIFEWNQDAFSPIMSSGLNIKGIHSIKINTAEMGDHKKSPINRIKDSLKSDWPYDQADSQLLAKQANYPEDLISPFMFFYKNDTLRILFLGEDSRGELARFCLLEEFNNYLWPGLYDLYKHCGHVKKIQDKMRENDYRGQEAKDNALNQARHVRASTVDPQSILDISNKLFSVYNENRLVEIYVEFLSSMLSASRIAAFTRIENRVFMVTHLRGQLKPSIRGLELSADSELLSSIMNHQTARVLPLKVPPSRPENFTDAAIYENQFCLLNRLYSKEDISAAILIGEKKDGRPYDEADYNLLTTLTNIASLALDNIAQYRLVEKLSYTDSMTELYNYRYFYKRLSEEIYRAKRFKRDLALVIFDIDNFKSINDSFGHQAGDEILKCLSNLVLSSVRAIDVVSRYGGEEFCIIMPDTGNASCQIFIERLRTMIAEYKFSAGRLTRPYGITVSCGGAIYPADAQTTDRLVYCADMALLKAKGCGRNRTMMYESEIIERDSANNKSIDNENTPENNHEV